jgi:hypothetical protein
MPSRNPRRPLRDSAIHALRGGKAIPAKLVRDTIARIERDKQAQLGKKISTQRQMAKHLGQARGPIGPDVPSDQAGRAHKSLLQTHEALAKRRLPSPKIPGGLGEIFPGQITATVVPPFDYDVIIPTVLAGNEPTLQGASDRNTGQMSGSAITATQKGFNGGSMYTTVGIYFHPPSAGTLRLSATPTFSFQWWTNSLQTAHLVTSSGHLGLTVYGVDLASQTIGETGTIISTAGNSFFSWDESQTAEVRFDFGFDIQAPALSAQLDVSRTLVYLLFVEAHVHVHGVGWPGSLAGAKLAVTVPYLTYDFQVQQVIAPD